MSKRWIKATLTFLEKLASAVDRNTNILILIHILKETAYKDKKSVILSYGDLAKALSRDRANINRAIKALKKKGLIRVRKVSEKKFRYTPNLPLSELEKGVVNNDYRGVVDNDYIGVVNNDHTTLLDNSIINNTIEKCNESATEGQLNLFEDENFHQNKKDIDGYEVPFWIDLKTWNDFLSNRKKNKHKATTESKDRIIKKLLRICGDDLEKHIEILDYSMENNYRGVFDPNSNKSNSNNAARSTQNALSRLRKQYSDPNSMVQ